MNNYTKFINGYIATNSIEFSEIIKSGRYEYHHTATHPGYIKRKPDYCVITPYNGRFGKGYKVERPRRDTTQYHYCEYWIEKSAD